MAVFSTDQNRQFYYAAAFKEVADVKNPAKNLATAGDITINADKDGFFHIYQKGKATLVKSDYIDPANIISVTASAPADMKRKLKKTVITLDDSVNEGKPIVGEDYLVRINFRQLYGMSDEDIYQKYGVVAATTVMQTKTDLFWLTLALSLFKNFKRTYTPLVKIGLAKNEAGTSVDPLYDIKNVNGTWKIKTSETGNYSDVNLDTDTTYKGIVITELSGVSEYRRGVASVTPVYFEVIPTTVSDGVTQVNWATVTNSDATEYVGNGYAIADLEYFCMGERGDQYREKMWPNNIVTEYFVDPTKEYYTLDIVYTYKGDTEDVQQSKKMITIVSSDLNTMKQLVAAFGTIVKKTKNYENGED